MDYSKRLTVQVVMKNQEPLFLNQKNRKTSNQISLKNVIYSKYSNFELKYRQSH